MFNLNQLPATYRTSFLNLAYYLPPCLPARVCVTHKQRQATARYAKESLAETVQHTDTAVTHPQVQGLCDFPFVHNEIYTSPCPFPVSKQTIQKGLFRWNIAFCVCVCVHTCCRVLRKHGCGPRPPSLGLLLGFCFLWLKFTDPQAHNRHGNRMCVSQRSSSCVAIISAFTFAHTSHFVNMLSKTSRTCKYFILECVLVSNCDYSSPCNGFIRLHCRPVIAGIFK